MHSGTLKTIRIGVSAALILSTTQANAQQSINFPPEFDDWALSSLSQISPKNPFSLTEDQSYIRTLIGQAQIVGLSESLHSASEPMRFRNDLFRYLVEELDFDAIVLESGLVESKVLNDYARKGVGNLDSAVSGGFTHGFDAFRQNTELLRWLRDHNNEILDEQDKVGIYGIDVSGSPGNLGASRKPDTALRAVLEYMDKVDSDEASRFHASIDRYLPVLASTNDYGGLPGSERDALTASITDLIVLLQRQQFPYTEASSTNDYQWALRSAISAQQVDSWFRQMPDGWVLSDGLDWTSNSQQIRDRVMADNLEWVLHILGPDAKVLVFSAVGHMSAVSWEPPDWMNTPSDRRYTSFPLGAYLASRHGEFFVNIFNMLSTGEIYFCGAPGAAPLDIGSVEPDWGESAFASLGVDEYLLDLRVAPQEIQSWLRLERNHRNIKASTRNAFDVVYYIQEIASDCQ